MFGFGLFVCISGPLHAFLGVESLELGADLGVGTGFLKAFGMFPHPFLLIFLNWLT